MADMLTNTVGIIIFILIFTVLTAGGVMIAKRLPLERPTDQEGVDFFCAGNRVIPIPDAFTNEFLAPFQPGRSEGGDVLARFNNRRLENDDLIATGDASASFGSVYAAIVISPKDGRGETAEELASDGSRFQTILETLDPKKKFVHLIVRSDSIAAFTAAREAAIERGLSTGWFLIDAAEPIRFNVGEGPGATRTPQ